MAAAVAKAEAKVAALDKAAAEQWAYDKERLNTWIDRYKETSQVAFENVEKAAEIAEIAAFIAGKASEDARSADTAEVATQKSQKAYKIVKSAIPFLKLANDTKTRSKTFEQGFEKFKIDDKLVKAIVYDRLSITRSLEKAEQVEIKLAAAALAALAAISAAAAKSAAKSAPCLTSSLWQPPSQLAKPIPPPKTQTRSTLNSNADSKP